jgi:protein-glutamine gamma-glutamyltransferase
MNPPAAARLPLRICVLISGLSGLFALATAQLLSIPVTIAVVVCFVTASAAPVWLESPEEAKLRRAASIAVLLLVGAYAGHSAVTGLGTDPLVSIGPILALLLSGLQVAHALVLNVRRDLLVGLTIGLFMTVLAAGLSPGPSIALPLLVGWPVAVTALVLAQRLEQLESGHSLARAVGSGRRSTAALVVSTAGAVAITMVVGLVVFLLLPQPSGLSARSRLLGDSQADPSSGEVRGADYYSSGVMDLRTRGSLSDAPVLDVPESSPDLWRGSVLGTYDGQAWYGTSSSLVQLDRGPVYSIPHPLVPEPPGAARTDTVHLLDQFSGTIVAPGVVDSVTIDGRLLVDSDGGLIATPKPGSAHLTSYVVTSVPEVVDPATLASAKGVDPADPRWLELPPTLPQRVRDLAVDITSGTSTRYDKVRAVEDYLRAHEKYRLDSPLPAPGADAVDDFLFTSNAGFCEQFASAEVVLLRSRGVPARMVTGLAYGTPAAGGVRRMLVSNAHAWVEVWYPGVGWSPSDPTAGSVPATDGGSSLLSRLLHGALDSAASRALAALLVGLGALITAFLLRRGLTRRQARRARAAAPPAGPVLAAFRRLELALAAAGRPRRPGESIGELRRRLPATGASALDALERECYGSSPPSPDASTEAARTLDELADSLAEVTRR